MANPAVPHASPASKPLPVLVIGANGYLGSAVCRAFLRSAGSSPFFFRVYGLVRRDSAAQSLAADEIIPIVGSLSDPDALASRILSESPTWHAIVVCTEPSKLDSAAEEKHWNDVLALVHRLAKSSSSDQNNNNNNNPVRPIVLWSSGCKDYGTTGRHGDPDLQPHTESSPLVPHPLVKGRMDGAMRALDLSQRDGGAAGFDAAIVRATPVFGYSGSYHGAVFDFMDAYVAATASPSSSSAEGRPKSHSSSSNNVLKIPAHPGTIMHGVHVDDCGDAYVALAKTAMFGTASAVAGQVFNISSRRYETLRDIAAALAEEYGFAGGVELDAAPKSLPGDLGSRNLGLVFGYSQWVASDKIRAVTGWTDKRPLFHENIRAFRLAYQAARARGHDNIAKTRERMAGNWGDFQ